MVTGIDQIEAPGLAVILGRLSFFDDETRVVLVAGEADP